MEMKYSRKTIYTNDNQKWWSQTKDFERVQNPLIKWKWNCFDLYFICFFWRYLTDFLSRRKITSFKLNEFTIWEHFDNINYSNFHPKIFNIFPIQALTFPTRTAQRSRFGITTKKRLSSFCQESSPFLTLVRSFLNSFEGFKNGKIDLQLIRLV